MTNGGIKQIPLSVTMPADDVTYATANSVTVARSGDYEVNYFGKLSVSVGTTVTLAVRVNGVAVPAATVNRTLSVGSDSPMSGSFLITLAAGDTLDMAISASLAVGVTLSGGITASLTVKKLN